MSSLGYLSCENQKELFFKLSLAQWSFHNLFQSGQKSPYEFAKISKELGFQGIEYVSQFYPNVSTDKSAFTEFVNRNKDLSNDNEVASMIFFRITKTERVFIIKISQVITIKITQKCNF